MAWEIGDWEGFPNEKLGEAFGADAVSALAKGFAGAVSAVPAFCVFGASVDAVGGWPKKNDDCDVCVRGDCVGLELKRFVEGAAKGVC